MVSEFRGDCRVYVVVLPFINRVRFGVFGGVSIVYVGMGRLCCSWCFGVGIVCLFAYGSLFFAVA